MGYSLPGAIDHFGPANRSRVIYLHEILNTNLESSRSEGAGGSYIYSKPMATMHLIAYRNVALCVGPGLDQRHRRHHVTVFPPLELAKVILAIN